MKRRDFNILKTNISIMDSFHQHDLYVRKWLGRKAVRDDTVEYKVNKFCLFEKNTLFLLYLTWRLICHSGEKSGI